MFPKVHFEPNKYQFEIKQKGSCSICHLKNGENLGVLTPEEYVNKALSPALHAVAFLKGVHPGINTAQPNGGVFYTDIESYFQLHYAFSGIRFDALKVESSPGIFKYFKLENESKMAELSTWLIRNLLGYGPRPQVGVRDFGDVSITVHQGPIELATRLKMTLLNGCDGNIRLGVFDRETAGKLGLVEVTEQQLNHEILMRQSRAELYRICTSKTFFCFVAACAILATCYKKPELLTNLKDMSFGMFEKASSFVMGK